MVLINLNRQDAEYAKIKNLNDSPKGKLRADTANWVLAGAEWGVLLHYLLHRALPIAVLFVVPVVVGDDKKAVNG